MRSKLFANQTFVLAVSSILAVGMHARAQSNPTTEPSPASDNKTASITESIIADLASGDQKRIDDATGRVQQQAKQFPAQRADDLMLLVDAHLYDIAEKMAKDFIASDPTADTIGRLQRVRVMMLIRRQQWPEAMSAARTYFNCSQLRDSADALSLIAFCLKMLNPRDPSVVDSFKQQQIASASQGTLSGQSQLLSIPIDPQTFATDANQTAPSTFRAMINRGNLLLFTGQPHEAGECFAKAAGMSASPADLSEAIEGQARAARAEFGCLGPANTLLAKLQNVPMPSFPIQP